MLLSSLQVFLVLLPLNTHFLRVFYTVDYTSIHSIFLYYNIHVKNVSWQHSCMKENGKGHMNFLFSVFYAWQTIKNTCHTVCSSVSRLNAVFSTFKNSYLVKNQNFSNSNYSITRITNILDCSFYRKFYSYWVLSKSLMKSHIICSIGCTSKLLFQPIIYCSNK